MTDKFITDLTSHDTSLTATVTISNASPAVISWTGHPLAIGQAFLLTTTGALPTGMPLSPTFGYVIAAGFGANSFQASLTPGGAAINTSSAGSGTHTAQGILADDTAIEMQRSASTTATEKGFASTLKNYIKSWIAKADVGLGNVSNNAQLTIANNLSDVNNTDTSRNNIFALATFFKTYVASRYYLPWGITAGTGSVASSGANRINFFPFFVPQKCTISELFVRIGTGSAGNWQAAIYAADASTLLPTGTVLAKSNVSGSTTTSSVSVNTALAANLQLIPGTLYWMGVNVDNAIASAAVVAGAGYAIAAANLIGNVTLSNIIFSGSNVLPGYYVDTITLGTWGDMTSATFVPINGNPPWLVGFKVASIP